LDQVIHPKASVSSRGFFQGQYNADDGSIKSRDSNFSFESGSIVVCSALFGDYNPQGKQISGYSANEVDSQSWGTGFSWSRLEKTGGLIQTTITMSGHHSSGELNSFLFYNSDATADGSVNGASESSGDLDVGITEKGPFKSLEGIGTLNDTDYRHFKNSDSVDLDLILISDNPLGTITTENKFKFTFNSTTDRKLDQKNDILHAKMKDNENGSNSTTDTLTIFLGIGTSGATRNFVFTQNGQGNKTQTADGKLADSLGHTGTWTYTSTEKGKITNDRLTLDLVWVDPSGSNTTSGGAQTPGWKETGRSFSIDRDSRSDTKYYQEDNGWVKNPEPSDTRNPNETIDHKLDIITHAENLTLWEGKPTNYTFTLNQSESKEQSEYTKRSWTSANGLEKRNSELGFSSYSNVRENHTGTNNNGEVNETDFDSYRHFLKSNVYRNIVENLGLQTKTVYKRLQVSELVAFRKGSSQNWTGYITLSADAYNYWETTDLTTLEIIDKGGTPPGPPHTIHQDLSSNRYPNSSPDPSLWTAFWEDTKVGIQNDPVFQWLYQNGGNLLRIGFGVLDVIGGLTTIGGTCGFGILPGVGLMAVGIDQIITGVSNWGSEIQAPSVFEYLGYTGAKGLGVSEEMSKLIGDLTPAALSLAFSAWGALSKACFAAGTPLLTPEGSKRIEEFRVGDLVLARDENQVDGPVEAKVVEEVFVVESAPIMVIWVGGQRIETTPPHPFFVRAKGWQAAGELQQGDELSTHDGRWIAVERIEKTEKSATVYNLRVGDYHTYFVGSSEWSFSVWAHNTCVYLSKNSKGVVDYVGITENPVARAAAHLRTKGIVTKPIAGLTSLTRGEARAIEQILIEHFGLGKTGGSLLNKINSIASTNPIYASSKATGTSLLHNLGLWGF
jgi:hypothetical protein